MEQDHPLVRDVYPDLVAELSALVDGRVVYVEVLNRPR
jgi:hypothetical protein